MKLFNINCKEISHICDKSQYNEARIWDIIKLKLHILYCRACKKHIKRNTKLTKLIKASKIEILDPKVKQELQNKVEQELTKQNP